MRPATGPNPPHRRALTGQEARLKHMRSLGDTRKTEMKSTRDRCMNRLVLCATLMALAVAAAPAQAEENYPAHPIRLIVPTDREGSRSVRNLERLTIVDLRRIVRSSSEKR